MKEAKQLGANGAPLQRAVMLPSYIVAALDQLDDAERQQVRDVLEALVVCHC